jgi:Immunity protein 10
VSEPQAFHASCVAVDTDPDAWVVTFADAEFNPTRYLLLQRDRTPTASDRELGLDGYHVEFDAQHQSCYGGIEQLELHGDRLVIAFDDEGASVLGGEGFFTIGFALRERQLEQLRACLADIFADSECYLDAI